MTTEAKPMRPLSEREGIVLDLYLGGLSVTDIAEQLDLSVKTISTYLSRCQDKYGVYSNAELKKLLQKPEVANG